MPAPNITEKQFQLTFKELVYIVSFVIAGLGQWYSQKAALNELSLTFKAETALLKLEIEVLKTQIEELKNRKQ